METRKQRKRSLRLTLLLLLLTAILLLTSSYAWFTANQTVTISELQVNVAAQNGLQISADGNKWSALINKDDLQTAAGTYSTNLVNQFPDNLAPVSTSGNVQSGKMDMFLGSVNADKTTGKDMLTATVESEATGTVGNFIAFDMFLKVEQTTDIELTANSNVKAVGTSKGIENAARVAFLVQGNLPAGTALDTVQKQAGATNATRYIWEPNYDVHTAAAVTHASSVYGISTTETGAAQIAYDGIKAEIGTGILLANTNATANSTYFEAAPIAYKTKANFGVSPDGGTTPSTDSQQIFTLNPGITKIRVYMWIEGQDVDCENTASGSNIAFNIQISRIGT